MDLTTLIGISPELILVVFGLAVLVLDLVWRERGAERLGWLAFAGLIVALIVAVLVGGRTIPMFANIYVSDAFTTFFRIIATVAGAIVLLASFDYLRSRTRFRGEFFALFTFAIAAMIFMAGSTNLLMIYLSTEFLSYSSYILTGFLREDKRSNEAALKYFLYGAICSAVMLYGISLFYGLTGSLNLSQIARMFSASPDISTRALALFSTALVLAGVGFKISLVPFHQWAPDAYEGAPTPVTAFLSVGPKAAGFAVLVRIVLLGLLQYQAGWAALFAAISIATMTLGNVIALRQTNLKRLLAYSSIAQAGYMLIGLVAFTADKGVPIFGLNGLLLYIFAYLFTNLGAFLVVIAIENATGALDISQYGGMMKRAPVLSLLLVLFFLSLIGIPPTAGFIGKFFVFAAAVRTNYIALAAIGVLNSVISLYYYFRVIRPMFFEPAPADATPIRASRSLSFALLVTAVLVFVVALVPGPFLDFANASMQMFGLTAFK